MCSHNSSVTSLLFTLFMIYFVECLQAPCPHPVLKSCPRVFSPGPLHPDPLHIYPGTTTDDSAVCCPVRHEPSVVHQVCLCIIYIIYMYVLSMYWIFILFSIEYQSFGIVVEQINKIICSTNYDEIRQFLGRNNVHKFMYLFKSVL